MKIDSLESIHVGDTTEWIRVRGADATNPVVLLIQQGPGLPMINEARRFERLLRLERDFTVVFWDQRGCGRSRRKQKHPVDITLEHMVDDTVSLLELSRIRFGGPAIVSGFSMGATIGAYAAARRPDLVAALVAVGMDIDGAAAENSAFDFATITAYERHNRRAIRQLEAIGPPPHLQVKQFSTRARWVTNFGGVTTNATYGSMARDLFTSLVRSADYSAGDIVRTFRGLTATRAALLAEIAGLDLVHTLPRIDVPVVMVQGRHDQVSPGDAAERYGRSLAAPYKELVWFEHSAHTPYLDEPDKFRDVLMRVRDFAQSVRPTTQ